MQGNIDRAEQHLGKINKSSKDLLVLSLFLHSYASESLVFVRFRKFKYPNPTMNKMKVIVSSMKYSKK